MTKEFGRTDFMYMQIVLWLSENYKDVLDDYKSTAFLEHNEQWLYYEKVNENEL